MVTPALLVAGAAQSFRPLTLATLIGYLEGGLTKDPSNPVFPRGTAGAWDDWGVRDFGILIDQNGFDVLQPGGETWAYYYGRASAAGAMEIGLAISTDGGSSWTRYGGNPIISPGGSWYTVDIATGGTIKLDNGSYVMVAGGDQETSPKMGVFTSTDGLSWSDAGMKLTASDFSAEGGAALDRMGAMCFIRRRAGDYLVLIEGKKSGVDKAWRIFGATATDPTGTWTPLNGGGVLMGPTGSGWESIGVANPRVIECEAGTYLVAYNGIQTNWRIGFAYGTDLTNLTRFAGNPVVDLGTGWDDLHVETSFLERSNSGTLRLWYQGYRSSDESMAVGLCAS